MQYNDFIYSRVALLNGVDNVPTPTQKKNIETFANNVIGPMYNKFGKFKIINCFLKIDIAKRIGKQSWSYHTQGHEIDIYYPDVDHLEVLKFLHNNVNFTFVKIENNIMHICACPGKNGKEIFINGVRKSYDELFAEPKQEIVNEFESESENREEA